MLPGNERQDVEKGGKSMYSLEIHFLSSNCDANRTPFIHFVSHSHYATIGSGSIDTAERRVSNAFQIDKQQEKSHHTRWRIGICC